MTRIALTPAARAEPAPPIEASQWFNGATSLAALRGRVVALHAFQMLCPGCVAHGLPQAGRIRAAFAPDDVAVVGLHSVFEHHDAMRPSALAAFLSEYRIAFPVAVDAPLPGGAVPSTMQRYGLRGTPSVALIDRAGRLRNITFGRPSDMAVGAAVAQLVAEPLPAVVAPALESSRSIDGAGCTPEGCAI